MKEKVIKGIIFLKNFYQANKSLSMKIIAALIIVATIIVILSCSNGMEYGNTSGNSSCMGIATQQGKWIYYLEYDNNEVVGICKAKLNGTNKEKVAEGKFSYLNVVDDYIYCLEYVETETQYNLIKIKTNGKNKEILARDIDRNVIIAVDNWVYYNKNEKLHRVKFNGTDRTKISDKDISYYQIDGDEIYYIYKTEGTQYIAKMETDGEESRRIAKAHEELTFETIYVKGGKIYYIASNYDKDYNREYYLYKMNKKGEKAEKVVRLDKNVNHINMQEDAIYYTVLENYNTYRIKRIEYNGTNKKVIKETELVKTINVIEDCIIYITVDEEYDSVLKIVNNEGKEEKVL